MSKEAYVSFEVAKLLKEKGFTWPCHYTYHGDITSVPFFHRKVKNFNGEEYSGKTTEWVSCPTLQMAMAWLREVHHLEIYPSHDSFQEHCNWWFSISKFTKGYSDCPYESDSIYFTYEEAVEAALKYCLENLI